MSNIDEQKHYIKKFGKKLKLLRLEKKMTQAQLAADANIEISQISRIERGVLNTTIGTAFIIAKALQVELEVLFVDLK